MSIICCGQPTSHTCHATTFPFLFLPQFCEICDIFLGIMICILGALVVLPGFLNGWWAAADVRRAVDRMKKPSIRSDGYDLEFHTEGKLFLVIGILTITRISNEQPKLAEMKIPTGDASAAAISEAELVETWHILSNNLAGTRYEVHNKILLLYTKIGLSLSTRRWRYLAHAPELYLLEDCAIERALSEQKIRHHCQIVAGISPYSKHIERTLPHYITSTAGTTIPFVM